MYSSICIPYVYFHVQGHRRLEPIPACILRSRLWAIYYSILSYTHLLLHSMDNFRNLPSNLYVFALWMETIAPRENLYRQRTYIILYYITENGFRFDFILQLKTKCSCLSLRHQVVKGHTAGSSLSQDFKTISQNNIISVRLLW